MLFWHYRGLQRDQERKANKEQRRMEQLAIRARTVAEAAAADAATEDAGERRPVFRSPPQYMGVGPS